MCDIKVGDSIGIIVETIRGDTKQWALREGKVKSVTINSRGQHIKADGFRPFHENEGAIDDLKFNTEWLLETPSLILVHEPFIMTDELRERVTQWIEDTNKRGEDDAEDDDT